MSANKNDSSRASLERVAAYAATRTTGLPLRETCLEYLNRFGRVVARANIDAIIQDMISRGTLERADGGFLLRAERLLTENKALIQARQNAWHRGSIPKSDPTTSAQEPHLPLSHLEATHKEIVQNFIDDGLIARTIVEGEIMVAETDYLSSLPAAWEGPFWTLAELYTDQSLFRALLSDELEYGDVIERRSGELVVSEHALSAYLPRTER